MSYVVFELDGQELRAECGARLLDLLDDAPGHRLRVNCRSGNCGTCRVRVIAGSGQLEQPAAAERAQLLHCGAAADERLGCQLCVSPHAGGGRVRIERVG